MPTLTKIKGTVYRSAQVAVDGIVDEVERLVRISFSSEMRVLRASWFEDPWVEVLGHDKGEVNLARLNNGATVHYNHSRSRADRVGVVESAEVRDGRGEAVVRFSKNQRVDDIWDDVKDGVLRNISVGYSIDQRKLVKESNQGEPDEYRVTRWTPMEISFCDIPADPSVGVGREGLVDMQRDANYSISQLSEETDSMKLQRLEDETDAALAERQRLEDERVAAEEAANQRSSQQSTTPTPDNNTVELDVSRNEGIREGRRLETERRAGISDVIEPFERNLGEGFVAFRDALLDDAEMTVEVARTKLLDELGKEQSPMVGDVRVIETSAEKFREAATMAIHLRANLIPADKREAQRVIADEVRSFSLFDMARRCIELEGGTTARLSRMDLVARAFTSSDFPLILVDAANKAMLKGFEEAPETWQVWAQVGSLSDFKIGRRVNLSSFDDLELVNENGEFKYGAFTEQGETIQLATYGKLFAISRQAIINDDLSAFTAIPSRMGRSASRLVGDLAYGIITANANLDDGIALFAGTAIGTLHGNLNIGGAGVIDEARLGSARQGMARQSDASNSATGLNIRPSFLLVPLAIEDRARVQMTSEFNPDEGVTTSFRAPNIVRGLAEVVPDPRLDVDSATRWYLAAGQQFDTIEVAFLDGVQAPTMEQQMGWNVDGTEFKVRLDVGASAMEFRTWQRNDGV